MKKIVFSILISVISINGFSQDRSFEEKASYLIELTAGQQFEIMTKPIVNMVPEENQEAFKKELNQSIDELYSKMAVIYMESFTEEELDEILEFYNTPVGKKMVATTPELMQKGMEIGQQWGMELQPLITKYTN